jgi:hypothetical protein
MHLAERVMTQIKNIVIVVVKVAVAGIVAAAIATM